VPTDVGAGGGWKGRYGPVDRNSWTIHVYWGYCVVLLPTDFVRFMYSLFLFMFISSKIRLVATNLDACETNSVRLLHMLCTSYVFAGQFQ
jgi:hypothetical protein